MEEDILLSIPSVERVLYVTTWERGDINRIQKTLANGTPVNQDAMLQIVEHCSLDIIKSMLRIYICTNKLEPFDSLLGKALYRGEIEIIEFLLDALQVPITSYILEAAFDAYQWQIDEYRIEPRRFQSDEMFIENIKYVWNTLENQINDEFCSKHPGVGDVTKNLRFFRNQWYITKYGRIDISDSIQNMVSSSRDPQNSQETVVLIRFIFDKNLPILYDRNKSLDILNDYIAKYEAHEDVRETCKLKNYLFEKMIRFEEARSSISLRRLYEVLGKKKWSLDYPIIHNYIPKHNLAYTKMPIVTPFCFPSILSSKLISLDTEMGVNVDGKIQYKVELSSILEEFLDYLEKKLIPYFDEPVTLYMMIEDEQINIEMDDEEYITSIDLKDGRFINIDSNKNVNNKNDWDYVFEMFQYETADSLRRYWNRV